MNYITFYNAFQNKDASIQSQLNGINVDGVYGPRTEMALISRLDQLWADECQRHGWIFRQVGRQVPRTRNMDKVILHWPGSTRTASSLGDSWQRNLGSSNVSSNFGIDENEIIWYAGPHMRTNHCSTPADSGKPPGYYNESSVGGDICVPILGEHEGNARQRNLFVGRRENRFRAPNGGHHGGDWLEIHPAMAMRVAKLRKDLEAIGLSVRWVDHAYCDPNNKWDCRPWRNKLHQYNAIDIQEESLIGIL